MCRHIPKFGIYTMMIFLNKCNPLHTALKTNTVWIGKYAMETICFCNIQI